MLSVLFILILPNLVVFILFSYYLICFIFGPYLWRPLAIEDPNQYITIALMASGSTVPCK